MSKTCQNCGREHEGQLVETFTDGDNLPVEIIVCYHARYEEESPKTLDEEAFNGAQMAGVKKRGIQSVQTVRMYKGEVVKPVMYYNANVKKIMTGSINDEIVRDPHTGRPVPFKSIGQIWF